MTQEWYVTFNESPGTGFIVEADSSWRAAEILKNANPALAYKYTVQAGRTDEQMTWNWYPLIQPKTDLENGVEQCDDVPRETKTVEVGFRKYDGGKAQFECLDLSFVEGIGRVSAYGADKYDRGNWKLCTKDQAWRYFDAAMRHLLARGKGEVLDPESGMPHAWHTAFNLMAYDWIMAHGEAE